MQKSVEMEEYLHDLEQRLGYSFMNKDLLLIALTHPSFAVEQTPPEPDNQRLEFLGDAVLQLVVTDRLFQEHLQVQEGVLTKMRSSLTNEDALVKYATILQLGNYLRLGKGEEKAGGRERPSNVADAFEAILGAIYLDGGINAANQFCIGLLQEFISDIETLLANENPKGALQEFTQEHFSAVPTYEVVEISGPEHNPIFSVRLLVDDRALALAKAGSRKSAEKIAAAEALKILLQEKEERMYE